MKKVNILWAVAASLLLSLASCSHQEKMLASYSIVDSASQTETPALFQFVWQDGMVQQVELNNPSSIDRPEYEDWASIFNYTLDYAYENGILKSLTGNKYRTVLSFENDKLVGVDQYSKDGVHAYRLTLSYDGSDNVGATYYAMSHEAISWLETILYPRNDSTGSRMCLEMPEDTSLHISATAQYRYKDGNLVYAKTSYADGPVLESTMEYDNKINPFYRTYCEFGKMDALAAATPFAFNSLGLSKNNLTKSITRIVPEGDENQNPDIVFEYNYEYDGDYPTLMRCPANLSVYRYEYAD